MNEINPLNVLNQREVSRLPEHFTVLEYKVSLDQARQNVNKTAETIKNWIFNNLDGRFYVASCGLVSDDSNINGSLYEFTDPHLHYLIKIGFEIPEESTFFSLAFEG